MSKVIGTPSKVAPAQQTPKEDQNSIVMSSDGLERGGKQEWQHLVSISPSTEEGQAEERTIVINSMSGFLQLAKMLAVVAIPVIALVAVCSLQLSSAVHEYNAADVATGAFQEFLRLDSLVTGVQLERGTSAAWVSSRGANINARVILATLWVHNDDKLKSLTRWPPNYVEEYTLLATERAAKFWE